MTANNKVGPKPSGLKGIILQPSEIQLHGHTIGKKIVLEGLSAWRPTTE